MQTIMREQEVTQAPQSLRGQYGIDISAQRSDQPDLEVISIAEDDSLMPISKAPTAKTPERAKLVEAMQQVANATAALQQAEADHDVASNAYRAQRRLVWSIEERRDALIEEANRRPPIARAGYQERVDEYQPALHEARLPLMQLGEAEATAEATATTLSRRLAGCTDHVSRAATAVAKAEAPAIAAVMADRVTDALRTIAQAGPDLAYLLQVGLVQKDIVAAEPFAARLLDWMSTEWPGFAAATRNSPWHGVVAALSNDPDAALPSAPTP